jgi:hypothetical protein
MLEEFRALVTLAQETQAEAERLCDEANESGTENNEFEVRDRADDIRAEALTLAEKLLSNDGPVVHRVLDLSTGHLPKDVCDVLNGFDAVTAYNMPYGWLLWVPADDLDERLADHPDTPEPVIAIWRYAIERGCAYVLIDRDADAVDGLQHWVW